MQAAAANWHKYLNVHIVAILICDFKLTSISSCRDRRTSSLLVPSISQASRAHLGLIGHGSVGNKAPAGSDEQETP